MITKQQVLDNLSQVKTFIDEIENKKEEKVVGIAIKNRLTGSIIFQSTKTTYKEAIIEKGDANLSYANLSYADLSYADLNGANLSYANLSYADLNGTNLNGADLYDADLRGANLYDAELHNAKFYGIGGTKELTKKQLPDFLAALGFKIVD